MAFYPLLVSIAVCAVLCELFSGGKDRCSRVPSSCRNMTMRTQFDAVADMIHLLCVTHLLRSFYIRPSYGEQTPLTVTWYRMMETERIETTIAKFPGIVNNISRKPRILRAHTKTVDFNFFHVWSSSVRLSTILSSCCQYESVQGSDVHFIHVNVCP